MEIKLTPFVGITHYSEAIKVPDKGPYWIYTEDWEQYHRQCQAKAGFPDPLPSYRKGSAFYRPEDITTGNLTRLVLDHTRDTTGRRSNKAEGLNIAAISNLLVWGEL